MDIALAFDAGYVRAARVAMESVLAANDTGAVRFWLAVTGDVTAADRATVLDQVAGRAEVTFLDADPGAAEHGIPGLPGSGLRDAPHLNSAIYLRLLLPDLLPPAVARALYLDCDVLCVGPLAELVAADLAGRPVGAVRDAFTRRLLDQGGMPGLTDEPRLDPWALYFNSGMLLMDLPAWRAAGLTGRAIEHAHKHRERPRFPDQDALNFVLHDCWQRLPVRWNDMMHWRREPAYGGRLTDSAILHFTGPRKPWHDEFPAGARRTAYARAAARAGVEVPWRAAPADR